MPYLWPWWAGGSEYERQPGEQSGGGGAAPGQGGAAGAGGVTGRPVGTGFVNLQNYMAANKGYGAPDIAGAIQGRVGPTQALWGKAADEQAGYDWATGRIDAYNQELQGVKDLVAQGRPPQDVVGQPVPPNVNQLLDRRYLEEMARRHGQTSQQAEDEWWNQMTGFASRPSLGDPSRESADTAKGAAEAAAAPLTKMTDEGAKSWGGRMQTFKDLAYPGYAGQHAGFDVAMAGAEPWQKMAQGFPGLRGALRSGNARYSAYAPGGSSYTEIPGTPLQAANPWAGLPPTSGSAYLPRPRVRPNRS